MHAVNLNRFSSAPADDLRPQLTDCLAVPRWVDKVLAGRPYADLDTLLASAGEAAAELSGEEIHAALAGHLRRVFL